MKHLFRLDIIFILIGIVLLVLGAAIEKRLGGYAGGALAFFILAALVHHRRMENGR